MIVMMMV